MQWVIWLSPRTPQAGASLGNGAVPWEDDCQLGMAILDFRKPGQKAGAELRRGCISKAGYIFAMLLDGFCQARDLQV